MTAPKPFFETTLHGAALEARISALAEDFAGAVSELAIHRFEPGARIGTDPADLLTRFFVALAATGKIDLQLAERLGEHVAVCDRCSSDSARALLHAIHRGLLNPQNLQPAGQCFAALPQRPSAIPNPCPRCRRRCCAAWQTIHNEQVCFDKRVAQRPPDAA